MKKNLPLYIFITVLVVVVIIAMSVVVRSYNENKPINPDANYEGQLSVASIESIKSKYNAKDKNKEFLKICEEIELAVANKLLDGHVTNEIELADELDKINNVFATNDWTYLGIEFPSYWMGAWRLDSQGKLYFTFRTNEIVPDWVTEEEIAQYIR